MHHWSIVEEASEADLAVLIEGVIRYGRSLAVGGDARPIACFVRDERDIVAGASGRTEFNRLFVGYLWVDETLRSRGLGSKVLSKLEMAASKRGCIDALIETLNDRTAQLYARLGYRQVAKIPRYVGSFTRHVLVKSIAGACVEIGA